MKIRKAKLKDIPIIVKLAIDLVKYHEKFDKYFEPVKNVKSVYSKYFKNCIYSTKKKLLVALDEDRIIGYALGEISVRSPVFKKNKIGIINDMLIIKEYRRKKIANSFLKELFDWFNSKKIKNIELTVHSNNPNAISAWKKYGFKDFMIKKRLILSRKN